MNKLHTVYLDNKAALCSLCALFLHEVRKHKTVGLCVPHSREVTQTRRTLVLALHHEPKQLAIPTEVAQPFARAGVHPDLRERCVWRAARALLTHGHRHLGEAHLTRQSGVGCQSAAVAVVRRFASGAQQTCAERRILAAATDCAEPGVVYSTTSAPPAAGLVPFRKVA